MLQRELAAYLSALQTHHGRGLPPLPLPDCAKALGLDGLAFLISPEGRPAELMQSHGPHTEAVEDLQLTQGQGPTLDAARDGALVLVPDLTALGPDRWPGLPGDLIKLGVQAAFAFPLRIGVIVLGVVSGYRTTPGPMNAAQLADALSLTRMLTAVVTGVAGKPGTPASVLFDDGLNFAEVHQATGMIASQLEIPAAQALARLRAHAFSHGLPILRTARDVLEGRLRLNAADQDTGRGPEQP
ncbi:GAF domain-containing protein [Streptomyces sp. H27-D2]|uniref:GAF domain-containing protein n=1 Tax=Streptomyces sp. H27-D2 TaxID=3046304 RepID=UPI002DB68DC8|nr:GAF domain-containing protein [Streptomyces sp. H27-D2]MEC4020763.1 GAF domain-containing protein [Streptomyces sp. H27-D2]